MLYENHKNKLLMTSVLFLLVGIAFMVYPANSMIMLVRITGIFLILLGVMIFIPSLRDKNELGVRFWALTVVAVIIVAFGVIVLVQPVYFVEAFWIMMGIILILDGIKNFMYLSAVPFKLVTIILSILSIICGVLILTHPFGSGLAYMIVMGAFFTYSGASGIFLNIAGKLRRKQKRDILDDLEVEGETVEAEAETVAEDGEAVEEAEVIAEDAETAAEDAKASPEETEIVAEDAEPAVEDTAEAAAPKTEKE